MYRVRHLAADRLRNSTVRSSSCHTGPEAPPLVGKKPDRAALLILSAAMGAELLSKALADPVFALYAASAGWFVVELVRDLPDCVIGQQYASTGAPRQLCDLASPSQRRVHKR